MKARAFERATVDKRVYCTFEGQRVPALLYDLSVDGCMIDVPDLYLETGDSLTLELSKGNTQEGQVVWERGGAVGLRFSTCLRPSIVVELGYKPSDTPFSEQDPRDSFGRELPNLPPALKVVEN